MSEDRTDSDPLMRRLTGAGGVSAMLAPIRQRWHSPRVEDPQMRAAIDRGGRACACGRRAPGPWSHSS